VATVVLVGAGLSLRAQALDARSIASEADRVGAEGRTTEGRASALHDEWAHLMDEVDRAQAVLTTANRDRDTSAAELASTSAERESALVAVDQLRQELAGVHDAAAQARSEARQGAALADALSTCLIGVSQLLNQLSVGDDGGAAATARRIGEPCSIVGVAVGS
jgi:hypothetical protein